MKHSVTVNDTSAGLRLDKFLSAELPEFSRSRIQTLIEDGHVMRAGKAITDSSAKVKPGEEYEVVIPETVPSHIAPVNIELKVVYEDKDILVIDKPAGMTVHPAPGHHDDTLVNALLAHCGESLSGIGGVARPGIVHRIDKDTSGLLVVAKNDDAHHALAKQLADRTLKRVYQCVVWGTPKPLSGSIKGNIGRSPKNRKKMAIVAGGKEALTHYKVLEVFPGASLVECRLETGRTHQIRVHLSHQGHSLVGDPVYGSAPAKKRLQDVEFAREFPRQALHAAELALLHPKTLKNMEFLSPLPEDLKGLIKSFRGLKSPK